MLYILDLIYRENIADLSILIVSKERMQRQKLMLHLVFQNLLRLLLESISDRIKKTNIGETQKMDGIDMIQDLLSQCMAKMEKLKDLMCSMFLCWYVILMMGKCIYTM